MKTIWTEFKAPDASTDRGWLKALCEPYDRTQYAKYTHETLPVFDEDINAWREQSTLGNYLDYRPVRPGQPGPHVHAVCYASHEASYFMTVWQAKVWIEERTYSRRPELRGAVAA